MTGNEHERRGTIVARSCHVDPVPPDDVRPLDLEHEVRHVLEEARMIVPGVQALFGFQLVSVFNTVFLSKLGRVDHIVHFAAICWTAIAMGLVMAPAAFHRQAERGMVSKRLVRVGSRLLQGALWALTIGIGLDTHLIAALVFGSELAGVCAGTAIALFLVSVWFVYPHAVRRRRLVTDDELGA
jgi:hypothetical protein